MRRGDDLTTFKKSGSLNHLEPSRPRRPVTGIKKITRWSSFGFCTVFYVNVLTFKDNILPPYLAKQNCFKWML